MTLIRRAQGYRCSLVVWKYREVCSHLRYEILANASSVMWIFLLDDPESESRSDPETVQVHIFCLVHIHYTFHIRAPVAGTRDATILEYVTNLVFVCSSFNCILCNWKVLNALLWHTFLYSSAFGRASSVNPSVRWIKINKRTIFQNRPR